MRYLTLYNDIDSKRKKKWSQIDKDELLKANIKYLKFLIGQNLSEKVKKNQTQNNQVNNEENKPPFSVESSPVNEHAAG